MSKLGDGSQDWRDLHIKSGPYTRMDNIRSEATVMRAGHDSLKHVAVQKGHKQERNVIYGEGASVPPHEAN